MKLFDLIQALIVEEETRYRKVTTLINPSPDGDPEKKQIGAFTVMREVRGASIGSCCVICEDRGLAASRLEYFENFVRTQGINCERGSYVTSGGFHETFLRIFPQVSSTDRSVIEEIPDFYTKKITATFQQYLVDHPMPHVAPAPSSSSSASSTEHTSFFDLLKEMVKLVENTVEEQSLPITDGSAQLIRIGNVAVKEKIGSDGTVHYDLIPVPPSGPSILLPFSDIMEKSSMRTDCRFCKLNDASVIGLVILAAPNTTQLQELERQLRALKDLSSESSARPGL